MLYTDFMKKGVFCIDERYQRQSFPLLYDILKLTNSYYPQNVKIQEEGAIKKSIITLKEGLQIESVLIPMKNSGTLCISSQVGCKKACRFCETGRMGLLKNLEVEEIITQVFIARFIFNFSFRNIVFMGMGEPFDNFASVKKAIDILTDPGGMAFGASRITVSTSGAVDKIYAMMEEIPSVHLAVSVNAPNDEIRTKIMPINRKWNMQKLKKAMRDYNVRKNKPILIEYVLLKDINDRLEHARELAAYLEGLDVKVNIIPYNPQTNDLFSPPPESQIHDFLKELRKAGFYTLLRNTKGRSIQAGCGQLGNVLLKK
ncbi:MAG: hypothetical protein Tsb0015_03850 [Simkaniaceae bacterium]